MPQPEIDKLQKGSGKAQNQAAISACIQREVNAGRDQKQAEAMCINMASEKTGG